MHEYLQQAGGWLLYKVVNTKEGKKLKLPCKLDGDSKEWQKSNFSYKQCREIFGKYPEKFSGLAIQPGKSNLVIIDLDHCLDENGKLVKPEYEELINASYAEISPGKRGLHVFFTSDNNIRSYKDHKHGIEVFGHSGYVTVTGAAYNSLPNINPLDTSLLPDYNTHQEKYIEGIVKNAENPLEKPGIIGAFCRTYNIAQVIEKFLPDIYESGGPDRYKYIPGTGTAGARVYDDGNILFSSHGSDPAGDRACNSFDLVRIHTGKETKELVRELSKLPEVMENFNGPNLKRNNDGVILKTMGNIREILNFEYDIKKNDFTDKIEINGHILRDADISRISYKLENEYGIYHKNKTLDTILVIADQNSYHPVREYFNSLEWDGVKRVDRLLIDNLGADDNQYNKDISRKTLCAAMKRIYEPGAKFDSMLTLVGMQGIGKSRFCDDLAGEWFSDSLSMHDVGSKDAQEKLKGNMILEISELAGLKKAEVSAVKSFTSARIDKYRAPYARVTEEFPRQCIFIGTTNEESFLRDQTGNRRFWPVRVTKYIPFDVDQVWAEVKDIYKDENLWLDNRESEIEAEKLQREFMETNETLEVIEDYLMREFPAEWWNKEFIGSNYRDNFKPTKSLAKMTSINIILQDCFDTDISRGKLLAIDIKSVLKKLGYEPTGSRVRTKQYGRIRLWEKIH